MLRASSGSLIWSNAEEARGAIEDGNMSQEQGNGTVFAVEDMSCGKCVERVTKAIHALQGEADVHVDLAAGLVTVNPRAVDPEAMADAIAEAGYPARLVESLS
jgi:copper chaperone CopZ